MTKKYDIQAVSKRTQRSFGVPKIKLTGNDDIDVCSLISQMNTAAADAWIIYLSEELGLIDTKGMRSRFNQFLEDITWVDNRIQEIMSFTGCFGGDKLNRRSSINGNRNLWTWIRAYSNLLECDIAYSSICTKEVTELVVNRLTDLTFLGKEYILSTRFFAPMGLVKVCESLLVILKTNKKKGNESNVERLERVLIRLKEIV